MRYSIHQLDATTWDLRDEQHASLGTFNDGVGRTGYDLALLTLGQVIAADTPQAAIGSGDGLLADGWMSDVGIAFSEKLAGGRDFTSVAWTWRDPQTGLVPLMFQTENEGGHYGAELVGFFTDLSLQGGTVNARGRFYDTEIARQAHDTLLDGRRFGISVDPSEKVEADYDFTCIEWDDQGFCLAGDESVIFHAYEIAGATMCPFPGFEQASVVLDSSPGTALPSQPMRASLSIPTAPPRDWMTLPEPVLGAPFVDALAGDDVLVEQLDNRGAVVGYACPLTIRDDGLVYGHLTYWGQCHTGNPWGPGMCASAEPSADEYRVFHSSGSVKCDDGTEVPTGRLVVGCEHSEFASPEEIRDHLAHAGMGWANVRVVDGEYGPWMCGVLEPSLTPQQVATLRALSMSGEWIGELGGILSVNASGLPIQRKMAASAFGAGDEFVIPTARVRATISGGKVTKLIGANLVRACPECQKRRLAASGNGNGSGDLAEIRRMLSVIDRRTRHLVPAEAAAMLDRLASRT